MKKNILTLLLVSMGVVASAQTEYDALRLTQTDLNGTARYMSMGGAFGALGGDASALKDNPAGLGVYRSSEISATVNTAVQGTNATWYGTDSKEDSYKLVFNNIAYVWAVPMWQDKTEGLLSSNFSFAYNRNHNFNRKMNANGVTNSSFTDFLSNFTNGLTESALQLDNNPYNNTNVPWLSVMGYQGYLISPVSESSTNWESAFGQTQAPATSSYISETGYDNDYSFGWGGNWNNKFFLGANLNFSDISYTLKETLTEDFGNIGNFDLLSYLHQEGMGINLKVGAIYLPTNNLRLGVAVHSPTFYSISETNYADLNYDNPAYDTPTTNAIGTEQSPSNTQDFNVRSAFQAQFSAAYLFGKSGLISAEYNFVNYPGMRLSDSGGDSKAFLPENNGMSYVMRNGNVLKLGAEVKLDPTLSLRAGYALYTGVTNPNYTEGKALRLNSVNTNTEYFNQYDSNYATFGMGYRQPGWFIDFAYALKMQKEDFYPYQYSALKPAIVKTNTHNILVTLGFKL